MQTSETIGKLAEALAAAQSEMDTAKKSKTNPFFKSKYADLASVFEAVRSVFGVHGLSIVQITRFDDGVAYLETRLLHKSGEWIRGELQLPKVNKPQEMGASLTYYRRYGLMAIAGIATDDDDDANSIRNNQLPQAKVISTDQVASLREKLNACPEKANNIVNMLKSKGISGFEAIPASLYEGIMKQLEVSNASA